LCDLPKAVVARRRVCVLQAQVVSGVWRPMRKIADDTCRYKLGVGELITAGKPFGLESDDWLALHNAIFHGQNYDLETCSE